MDFLLHSSNPSTYDDIVTSLGSRIFRCPDAPSSPRYYANFLRILRHYGPFDVVHSHVHLFSGVTLLLARKRKVPIRIAHSHSAPPVPSSGTRRLYETLMKQSIRWNATLKLAGSSESAASLYGDTWAETSEARVLYCGIDTDPYRTHGDPNRLRQQFNIPKSAFIIGHVGRFAKPKNHEFIVKLFQRYADMNPHAFLVLVGDGELAPHIARMIDEAGIGTRTRLLGLRSDIPNILNNLFDAFILPSLWEGLPLVGIEAQAAGLPFLVSDRVTKEISIVPDLVTHLPLESVDSWIAALQRSAEGGSTVTPDRALLEVQLSAFNIDRGCRLLEDLYEGI